jgi:excisionase family DNA binding protein
MLSSTLTVNEVAAYLKKRPRTIRQWIASGRLPAKKVGHSYLILEAEIGRMIAPAQQTEEVKEYDPDRANRLAELRKVLAGLRVADVIAFQEGERQAMGGSPGRNEKS